MEQEPKIDYGPIETFDTEALDYELLLANVPFNRLLETCKQRFLTNPQDYDTRYHSVRNEASVITPEERLNTEIIRLLGGRGLHGAELIHQSTQSGSGVTLQNTEWLAGAVQWTEYFNRPADPSVVRKLAAFGQAYMEDMYQASGVDLPQNLGDRTSPGEQWNTLSDLYDAISVMGKNSDNPRQLPFSPQEIYSMKATHDARGKEYYDPFRMSAAAYPNNLGITPTCGAQMAMVAGLCQAAGWPVLTANTLNIGEYDIYANLNHAAQIFYKLGGNRMALPQEVADSLTMILETSSTMPRNDRGFHGCNYIRFNDGLWYQADPTRKILSPYSPEQSQQLDSTYKDLHTKRAGLAPYTIAFNERLVFDFFDNIAVAAEYAAEVFIPGAHDVAVNRLQPDYPQLKELIDQRVTPRTVIDGPDGNVTQTISHMLAELIQRGNGKPAKLGYDYITDIIYGMTIKYALPGIADSLPPVRANDSPFQNNSLRRVLDHPKGRQMLSMWLDSAPLAFYIKQANDLAMRMLRSDHRPPHQAAELSVPDVNLATMVLGNYGALYATEEEQLPTAWHQTYNPNHMGTLLNPYAALGTLSEQQTVNNVQLLRTLPVGSLLDYSKQTRIEEFLEARGRSRQTGGSNGEAETTQEAAAPRKRGKQRRKDR